MKNGMLTGYTASELEALARAFEAKAQTCLTKKAQSEADWDSDGFRTQHGLGAQAHEYRQMAEWARKGGREAFTFLTQMPSGRIVKARRVDTKYGTKWLLDEEEAKALGCKRWLPVDDSHMSPEMLADYHIKGSRSRVQEELGLIQHSHTYDSVWNEYPRLPNEHPYWGWARS